MSEQQLGRLVLVRADTPGAAGELRSDPDVGQIRIVHPDRGEDMYGLLVEVYDEHVHGMLCGEECDLATDTDSILDSGVTGLPRPILVHGDVSGSILKRRLGRALGQIEPELVERVALRGRGLDFTSTDLGRGTAIAHESDPRWEWKLERHRHLRQVRARASELGWEIYSSALGRSDLLPRAGLSVRVAPAMRRSQPRAQLGRVLARSPRAALLRLESRDRLELLEQGPAPLGLSADQPRRPTPDRRGRTQPRTRGLRVASHERSSYLIVCE